MEKIWILGKDGKYEESSVIDKEIKETIRKKNERKRRRKRNGDLQENKGKTGELASDAVHRGGKGSVV